MLHCTALCVSWCQVVVGWVTDEELSVEVAARTLQFLNSPSFLRLDVDGILNRAWNLSGRRIGISEEGIALAVVLLVVSHFVLWIGDRLK
jgi:hypothetical protein